MFGELLHIDAAHGERLRATRPSIEEAERLAGGFRALGEPTRLSLALALRDGHELCVCDLSWIVERPQNLVSHHMKALKAQGVVRSRRDGKMTMYTLTAKGRSLLGVIDSGAE
ncbi:MAG TPA: metalloregulator ArsR/SmtB family transcription factor [Gaiellales bacterium]|jgi:DNA-binding transcriptional ArsR family regulator